jgi:GntR family transcriptional regulator of vanillate catabolism
MQSGACNLFGPDSVGKKVGFVTQLAKLGRITGASPADSVDQSIRDAILPGAPPQGKELSEVSLAVELGVSRTPVHLAIGRLAQEGLVEQSPGYRPRVVRCVLDALQARDPAAARHAMAAHIEARLRAVLRELDAQARAPRA